jgi:hypothetical protein
MTSNPRLADFPRPRVFVSRLLPSALYFPTSIFLLPAAIVRCQLTIALRSCEGIVVPKTSIEPSQVLLWISVVFFLGQIDPFRRDPFLL